MNVAKKLKRVTIEAFEAMVKDERFNYELIDGVVMMSPSPSFEHQAIGTNSIIALGALLKGSNCKPIYELDLKANDNVFQPDIMIYCDKNITTPEIVIEILSPSTRQKDILIKPIHYQKIGVKEYWIIDPKAKIVIAHDFINQTTEVYTIEETLHSAAIPKIVIAATDIFA